MLGSGAGSPTEPNVDGIEGLWATMRDASSSFYVDSATSSFNKKNAAKKDDEAFNKNLDTNIDEVNMDYENVSSEVAATMKTCTPEQQRESDEACSATAVDLFNKMKQQMGFLQHTYQLLQLQSSSKLTILPKSTCK